MRGLPQRFMRLTRHTILLAATVLLLSAVGHIVPAQEQPMRIVYYKDYEPYSWRDSAGEMRGILVDILDEILVVRLGLQVDHEGYPWVRAQEMVRRGEADAFCTVPTAARRQYTAVGREPVLENRVTLFTYSEHPDLARLESVTELGQLRSYRHGQYRGSGWAMEHLAGFDVTWVSDLRQVLRMLADHRVEVLVESEFVVLRRIRTMGLADRIVRIPVTLDRNTFNLCIGKESRYGRFLSAADEALGDARADGTLAAIAERYQ
jgi:polar amino acid transport system substrate-binding protein